MFRVFFHWLSNIKCVPFSINNYQITLDPLICQFTMEGFLMTGTEDLIIRARNLACYWEGLFPEL